jgi:hypothetical protein
MSIDPEAFGASFKGFMEQMARHKKPDEAPFFVRTLRDHFGEEPATLPIVAESFAEHEHPNLHVALEDYLARDGRGAEVLGVIGPSSFSDQGLAELVATEGTFGRSPARGPVEYVNVTLDDDRVLPCVQRGVYLIREGERRLAAYVAKSERYSANGEVRVEAMAPARSAAERLLADLREGMRARNVYRGHVLSLTYDDSRLRVKFHRLPGIEPGGIILPEGLLERIERHTIRFGRLGGALKAAGRHLKRGLLLHGPPGTGKTLTAMYLAGAMRDRTVLLLTGRGLGLIGRTCAMARALQPATVILEDVDLVAEERTRGNSGCATPLLFELLNEMDGLADDADILFLLTTNRPDLLEPALAARPGRVDQAILIPPPDADCRRRLFALYGRGLALRVEDPERFIARTEGASAAFLRELIRRAALYAADDGPEIVVRDRHLDEALHELVVRGGDLTKSLLGFQSRVGFQPRDATA